MQKAGQRVIAPGGMQFGLGTQYEKDKALAQRQAFNNDLNAQI